MGSCGAGARAHLEADVRAALQGIARGERMASRPGGVAAAAAAAAAEKTAQDLSAHPASVLEDMARVVEAVWRV